MKYDVFISYSRKDYDEVSGILQSIKGTIPGISCWFDIDGIESGDEFEDKIISAIDNSSYLLFALSENSIQSKWTKDEVMYARNTGKKIVPVLLKDARLKGWFLFKFGNIDCIDSTNALQMEKLLHNLSNWTGQPVVEKNDEPLCPCGSGKLFKDCHGQLAAVPETYAQKPIERTWKVGDFYDVDGKEGVVFWVDETGRHGKIVSMVQAQRQWCTDDVFNQEKLAGSESVDSEIMFVDCQFSYFDGSANTDLIRAKYKWWSDYPAVAWCTELGEGWYLPARDELSQLLSDDNVYVAINNTLYNKQAQTLLRKGSANRYWSSTNGVKYSIRPYVYFMADGGCYLKDGIFNCYIRAISTF